MRQLKTKYQGECRKCGKTLNIGDDAIYEKGVGIFCPECQPVDTEEIRAYRQEAAENKAAKYEGWASKREKTAMATLENNRIYTDDYAFNTQPGYIPLRTRVIRQNDKARESLQIVEKMTNKADRLRHVSVKGDAVKRYQAAIDYALIWLAIGMEVDTGFYGKGIVRKINKKTATVCIGSTGIKHISDIKVDLSFLSRVK